ncbi:hypothetical protein [Scytonema sp. NUACC26]
MPEFLNKSSELLTHTITDISQENTTIYTCNLRGVIIVALAVHTVYSVI